MALRGACPDRFESGLSSFGGACPAPRGRLTEILIESFFAWAFSKSIFIINNGLGQRHLLASFGGGREVRFDNVW